MPSPAPSSSSSILPLFPAVLSALIYIPLIQVERKGEHSSLWAIMMIIQWRQYHLLSLGTSSTNSHKCVEKCLRWVFDSSTSNVLEFCHFSTLDLIEEWSGGWRHGRDLNLWFYFHWYHPFLHFLSWEVWYFSLYWALCKSISSVIFNLINSFFITLIDNVFFDPPLLLHFSAYLIQHF